jgi:SAM-dependent methyltransferase
MIPRVLEPEVMDTDEEAIDYNTMDHSQVNRVFVDDLMRLNGPTRVLDVGTGTALIPIELCRRGDQWRVVAVDLARSMLDVGGKNVAEAGLAHAIELKLVDAKRLPFNDGAFPVVMSNSIIHHIPHPADCLAEMIRVVASQGGLLFVRDLLRPDTESHLKHLVQAYAGDSDAHQQKCSPSRCTPRSRSKRSAAWPANSASPQPAFSRPPTATGRWPGSAAKGESPLAAARARCPEESPGNDRAGPD